MLPFVDIASAGPGLSVSAMHRMLDLTRSGGWATIAAWLLTLVTPSNGAALREPTSSTLPRATPPESGLPQSLPCELQWVDYHVRRALGLPCTPPSC